MKKLARNEMKRLMGGNAPQCVQGLTITGYSGGGVPGECKLDLRICNQSCECIYICEMPAADNYCSASN